MPSDHQIAKAITGVHWSAALKNPQQKNNRDYVDIIIALGMAKEGFDWIWCEHALTIGYRSSLTEIIQIIGRATRDAKGKTHSRFTNLIAEPDASEKALNPDAKPQLGGNTALVDGVGKFAMDLRDLDIDLIDRINPFGEAYAIFAKAMNENSLKQVAAVIAGKKSKPHA